MGPRTRRLGVALGAALMPLLLAVPTSGVAQSRLVSATNQPVVSPFFIQAVHERRHRSTLTGIRVGAVTQEEHAITACSVCGNTRFPRKKVESHQVLLGVSPPLRMRPTTRVVVGVTAHDSIGRWIEMGFQNHQYMGMAHGCMPPTVTKLTPADAADPSTIPGASCGGSSLDTEYVYWRGTDGQLYEQPYRPPRWRRPLPIGSGHGVASAPSAVVLPNGERDVFWQGTDGWLHEMSYTGFWSNARRLPARSKLTSAPCAVVGARGTVYVFFRSTDGFLWEMLEIGGVWSLSAPINSGTVKSACAAVVRQDGSVELFWGKSGLWEMRLGQSAFELKGAGPLGSGPTAIVDTQDSVHVFWKGTNDWLWELSSPDTGSGSVQRNSGEIGSAPSAVIHPDGVQDVFWRTTNGGLREMQRYSGKWHLSFGVPGAGKLGSAPAAVVG